MHAPQIRFGWAHPNPVIMTLACVSNRHYYYYYFRNPNGISYNYMSSGLQNIVNTSHTAPPPKNIYTRWPTADGSNTISDILYWDCMGIFIESGIFQTFRSLGRFNYQMFSSSFTTWMHRVWNQLIASHVVSYDKKFCIYFLFFILSNSSHSSVKMQRLKMHARLQPMKYERI